MAASRQGHEKIVALLLSKGAEVNVQVEDSSDEQYTYTALSIACFGGFLGVVDLLTKAGADLELGEPSPLEMASKVGHKSIVKKLQRLKKEKKNVVKAEDTEGYRGDTQDLDSLLQFIDGEENKKKSQKASDKAGGNNTKKVSSKSDVGNDGQKLRKKKGKSQEKDLLKPSVTKNLSIEEDFKEKRANGEDVENSLRASESPEKVSCVLS